MSSLKIGSSSQFCKLSIFPRNVYIYITSWTGVQSRMIIRQPKLGPMIKWISSLWFWSNPNMWPWFGQFRVSQSKNMSRTQSATRSLVGMETKSWLALKSWTSFLNLNPIYMITPSKTTDKSHGKHIEINQFAEKNLQKTLIHNSTPFSFTYIFEDPLLHPWRGRKDIPK